MDGAGLSEHERRILTEIEQVARQNDAALDLKLRTMRSHPELLRLLRAGPRKRLRLLVGCVLTGISTGLLVAAIRTSAPAFVWAFAGAWALTLLWMLLSALVWSRPVDPQAEEDPSHLSQPPPPSEYPRSQPPGMGLATCCLVVVDCPDPHSLAAFYAGVLGGTITFEVEQGGHDRCHLHAPGGHRITFQGAPDLKPPRRPPAADKAQQLHLDFTVPDLDAAQAVVLALGATPLDLDDNDGHRGFRVYADPAGHPFRLLREGKGSP